MNNDAHPQSLPHVAVTGAAGFIGSTLVDALLRAGHEVTAIDVRGTTDRLAVRNLKAASACDRFRLHNVDLGHADLAAIFNGADTVYHLAGLGGVRGSWGAHFVDYVTTNLTATHRVIDACEQTGVRRLIYASSSSVYGSITRSSREDDATRPISPYGVTKLAAEQLCLAHATRSGTSLSAVALRYFTVYGPRQRPGMAIDQMLLAALTRTPAPLFGDGEQRREFTYVDDVVRATIAAADPAVPSTVINVGGGKSVTMLDVLHLIATVTGSEVPIRHEPDQAGDVLSTSADLTLAEQLLGYRPRVGLLEGLSRHAQWLTATLNNPTTETPAETLETTR
ncbi:NAD-dependent epimerase/dehydratase family protein [Promicromonospora vindobonensis]|uniref:NAD-dependent epimerase/dehydratase family protein n=1 Tax=Promicromonospora vindobonensis TaxID=195748 RepID=A0ABW5VNW7_9MICO